MGLKGFGRIHPEGKYIVNISRISISKVDSSCEICLKAGSYDLHKILPNKVDPLVSLMMVEKVPDSTYDMVEDSTNRSRKSEVIELPVKHRNSLKVLVLPSPRVLSCMVRQVQEKLFGSGRWHTIPV